MLFRAVHLGNYTVDDLGAALEDISRARFNVIQWEIKTQIDLDVLRSLRGSSSSGPVTSKAKVRQFLQEAAKRQIVVVPSLKLLTHQRSLFAAEDLRDKVMQTYPGLLYIDDIKRDGVYNPRFKLSDGRSFYSAIVFPLLDEVIELFSTYRQTPAVAIGHDEATQGTLKRVAESVGDGTTPGQLFAADVLTIHDYLAQKERFSVMWGDMLLHPQAPALQGFTSTSLHGHWDDVAPEALEILADAKPRWLIVGDWHYRVIEPEYKSNDYLQGMGFRVAGATWNLDSSTLGFVRDQFSLGGHGMIATVWNSPELYAEGNRHLMAFSGDAFWTGGSPKTLPNSWPYDPRLLLTNGQGDAGALFIPGDKVNVWLETRDAETPNSGLKNFSLSYKSQSSSEFVRVDSPWIYDAHGPGFGFQHSWKTQFTLPSTLERGRYALRVVYADAEGIPNVSLHTKSLFVGRTNGPNLIVNGGFESSLDAADAGWRAFAPPSGVSFEVTDRASHNGTSAAMVEVSSPSACEARDGGCSFAHTRQDIDISTLNGAPLYVRYWLKTEGRSAGSQSEIDLVLRDAAGTTVCWPDRNRRDAFCHVESIPGSSLPDQPWASFEEVLVPPKEAAQIQVRLRQQNNATPRGRSFFDDVQIYRLANN